MLDFTIKPDGGDEYKANATARDFLVWEKTSRGKTWSGLMADLNMVDLYKIAHIASRRMGLFDGSLPEFEETCELQFQHADEEDLDPTPPAASADDS